MAYKQYTHCTPTADFDPLNQPLTKAMTYGGLIAMIAGIFAQALIPYYGIYFVLGGGGFLLAAIINTFEYLLGGKLICLGGDKLAIGSILSIEPPGSKDGIIANIDDDLSINIGLCPDAINPGFLPALEAANLRDIDTNVPPGSQIMPIIQLVITVSKLQLSLLILAILIMRVDLGTLEGLEAAQYRIMEILLVRVRKDRERIHIGYLVTTEKF